ncbi:hypothetical protein GUITHDRAFT_77427 [Guillardia theta CCMP2712]|uniref:Mitochondrial carrier protein n=1 Tax=Guillardia theta (strain CCMP2712) TaxID=905079 RepID=L1IQF6_GUITC|nr:hypothetical protein GUITHDRAFT_77427 [Guillardia theta CCMP2712]EKX38119.1 hypothetical protein GUITHDRAFT_77427 [Guillardia theta CCMP2712]|eukprot:XP_005825099.1 hypothetical protein GUITHDRAFT_77427 [Guillardia theta CCMP2712]
MSEKDPSFRVALVAGGCAGTSVDVALFPIDTLKTRMQSPQGFYKAGGFKGVYNGMFAAAAGSAPGAALFFSTYETVKVPDSIQNESCYMASSSCGEVAACWIRVPTENVKQKMQAGMYPSTRIAIKGIFEQRGYRGFYVGYFACVLREIPFSFIQFPVYETLKKRWSEWQGRDVTPIQSALCGSIGGGFSAATTTPFDVVKTRLMLGRDREGTQYNGMLNAIFRIYAEGGVKKFFTGIVPRTVWIGLGGCVFFGSYESVKELLLDMM